MFKNIYDLCIILGNVAINKWSQSIKIIFTLSQLDISEDTHTQWLPIIHALDNNLRGFKTIEQLKTSRSFARE